MLTLTECLSLIFHTYHIPHFFLSGQLLHLYEQCFWDGHEGLSFHHRLTLVIVIPPLLCILNLHLIFSELMACGSGGDSMWGSCSPLNVSHDTENFCQCLQVLAFPCDPIGSILCEFRHCKGFS